MHDNFKLIKYIVSHKGGQIYCQLETLIDFPPYKISAKHLKSQEDYRWGGKSNKLFRKAYTITRGYPVISFILPSHYECSKVHINLFGRFISVFEDCLINVYCYTSGFFFLQIHRFSCSSITNQINNRLRAIQKKTKLKWLVQDCNFSEIVYFYTGLYILA